MPDERAKQLALILQAIHDCEGEFAEVKLEFKKRLEVLHNEAFRLGRDILSGQMTIAEIGKAGD